MFPTPQDALPLPPRPHLDQYRKRAKELAAACRIGGEAIGAWARDWVTALDAHQPAASRMRDRDVRSRVQAVTTFATERMSRADCALTQAQFVIARSHGFESWPRLVEHIEGLGATGSPVSSFEQAADAIVNGDIDTLRHLLDADPDLVHARSNREHRATLLHHVSANGVEHFRQRTPANIVAVARLLIERGAEIDAEADVYGGGATTLGLTVTSAHPRAAGVQDALADLLLEHGARLDRDLARAALHNGCPEAAAHLVSLGATCDLEVAAGVGAVDVARSLLPEASATDAIAALVMASWYGRQEVVEAILDHGVEPGTIDPDDGKTALHVAAFQGDQPLVELLLARGAPVNIIDSRYRTPPLVWALHAWLVEERTPAAAYREVLLALVAAGAMVRPEWIDDPRIRADAPLDAALRGRIDGKRGE